MSESADFSDTLDSLATFGAAIGGTVASTYRAVNFQQNPVPRGSFPQSQPYAAAKPTNWNNIIILVLVGLGVLLGIKAISRKG